MSQDGDAAGREADRPGENPAARGWFAILKRVKAEVKEDSVPLLAAGVAFYAMLAIFRANPRWRWVSWGAVVALGLWLLGSVGFSYDVDNFGKHNQTYGALAAVIILLLWLLLPAFVALLGAEFDAETERQTALAESPQRR